jgi:hypothetical protein
MLLHGEEISIPSSRKQTLLDGNCSAGNERPQWEKQMKGFKFNGIRWKVTTEVKVIDFFLYVI